MKERCSFIIKISCIPIRLESQKRNNALFSTCRKIRHYVSIIRVCNGSNKVCKGSPRDPRGAQQDSPVRGTRQSELMAVTFIFRLRKLNVFSLTRIQVWCSTFILRGLRACEKNKTRPLLCRARLVHGGHCIFLAPRPCVSA